MTIGLDQLSKVVSVVSLAIGSIAAWYALPLDRQMKALQAETLRLDNALKVSEAELKRLEASRALSLELYKEVKTVLSSKDINPRQEEAIRVLVDSLAEDPFRWKLLQAIAVAAADPEVKQKAEVSATFFRDEAVVQAAPFLKTSATNEEKGDKPAGSKAYAGMRIDMFYCADTQRVSKVQAEQAMSLRSGNGQAVWRVRNLPEEINARPGYQIHQNLIRHNADERAAAAALQADLNAKLGTSIELMEIAYPTANYLSVFFCAKN